MEQLDGLQHMRVRAAQRYQSPGEAYVEGDASSASYFLAGVPDACVYLPSHIVRACEPLLPLPGQRTCET